MDTITLEEMSVSQLKKELKTCSQSASGRKAELQARLRQALVDERDDPETYEFEIAEKVSGIDSVLKAMKDLKKNFYDEQRTVMQDLKQDFNDEQRKAAAD